MLPTDSSTCYVHLGTQATTECATCHRTICDDCARIEGGGYRCVSCTKKLKAKKVVRLAVVGAVIVAGLVAATIMMRKPVDEKFLSEAQRLENAARARKKALAFAKGKSTDVEIRLLKSELATKPCDKKVAVRFADALNRGGQYTETVKMGTTFVGKCGAAVRLLEKVGYAQERLAQWSEAKKTYSRWIKERPKSSQAWLARGKMSLRKKDLVAAAADFRQAIANQNLAQSRGKAVLRFAKATRKLQKPCEGLFALRRYIAARKGDVFAAAHGMARQLEVAGAGICSGLAGTGQAVLQLAAQEGGTPVRAANRSGRFSIDPDSGLVVVTEAFAKKARIDKTGSQRIWAYVGGALRRGISATIKTLRVHKATAKDVEAIVVPSLPGNLDGVLGQSFLWRFSYQRDGSTLRLQPRRLARK